MKKIGFISIVAFCILILFVVTSFATLIVKTSYEESTCPSV